MFDVISLTMVARFDFPFGPKELRRDCNVLKFVEIGEVMNAPAGEELSQQKVSNFIYECATKYVGQDFEFGEMVDFVGAKPPYTRQAWQVNEKWASCRRWSLNLNSAHVYRPEHAKVAKSVAGYENPPKGEDHCGICKF